MMKKTVIALIFIAFTLASLVAVNFSHASSIPTIGVASTTQNFPQAKIGNKIDVNITLSNVQNLWAWSLDDLYFNPAILTPVAVTEGPFLQQAGQTAFVWTSNSSAAFALGDIPEIDDVIMSTAGASGSGVLATITFKVVSLGTSQIIFNSTTLFDTSQIVAQTGGSPTPLNDTAINANIVVGPPTSPTNSPSPASTVSSLTSPTPTSSKASNTTTPSSPTASPTQNTQAPEFPTSLIFVFFMIIVAASTLLITLSKRRKTTIL